VVCELVTRDHVPRTHNSCTLSELGSQALMFLLSCVLPVCMCDQLGLMFDRSALCRIASRGCLDSMTQHALPCILHEHSLIFQRQLPPTVLALVPCPSRRCSSSTFWDDSDRRSRLSNYMAAEQPSSLPICLLPRHSLRLDYCRTPA